MATKSIFVENNAEQILAELIGKYEELSKIKLNPADPERIMIDVFAYREQVLRAVMQRLIEGNFVQTARGNVLDYWGDIFGVTRNADEGDDAYRLRIIATNKTNGRGSKHIYEAILKALPQVADVQLYTLWDDSSIPPGDIHIYPLMKRDNVNDNGRLYGEAWSTQAEADAIANTLRDVQNGIIGDKFLVQNFTATPIHGSIAVTRSLVRPEADVRADITKAMQKYFDQLSLSMRASYRYEELENMILAIDGVLSVNTQIVALDLPLKSYYTQGTIGITITN